MQTATHATPTLPDFKRLKTLARLIDGREALDRLFYWAPGSEHAPEGKAALSNGHWLVIRTEANAVVFDKLLAKALTCRVNGTRVTCDDEGSWQIVAGSGPYGNRPSPMPRTDSLLNDRDDYSPADVQTLALHADPLFKAGRAAIASHFGYAYASFQARYLLPILGTGHSVQLRGELSSAKIVDANGDWAGVLCPVGT